MSKIKYLPHVDGLRALAVASVLLFHAKIPGFEGGFIGVDIFFVISGFLLTKILRSEIESGEFSYKRFYEKRIRRLFPALVPVFIFTGIFTYKFYLPDDFTDYAKSLASSLLYSSNWYFLFTSGYWDGPAEIKPLLHTWSLSVEEQFYAVFPFLLLINYKLSSFKKTRNFDLILIFSLISFLYSTHLVQSGKTDIAFFDSFSRFWEMSIGYIVAIYFQPLESLLKRTKFANLFALAAIVYAVALYDSSTLFPGNSALVPILGTIVLIANSGSDKEIIRGFLENKSVVYVGKISYSLYLWHWPIIVCANYYYNEPPLIVMFLCLALSFLMAILSYHFVENPFRRKQILSTRKRAFNAYIAASASFLFFCLYVYQYNGVIGRFPVSFQESFAISSQTWGAQCKKVEVLGIDGCSITSDKEFDIRKVDIFVWGDSLATTVGGAFEKISDNSQLNVFLVSNPSCPPVLGIWKKRDLDKSCKSLNESVLKVVQGTKASLFLVAAWNDLIHTTRGPFSLASLSRDEYTQSELVSHVKNQLKLLPDRLLDRKIFVLGQPPRYSVQIDSYVARNLLLGKPLESLIERDEFREYSNQAKDMFSSMSEDYQYLDIVDVFCPESACIYAGNNVSMYHDGLHLNIFGAEKLHQTIENLVLSHFNREPV